jgi:hypothetical protein
MILRQFNPVLSLTTISLKSILILFYQRLHDLPRDSFVSTCKFTIISKVLKTCESNTKFLSISRLLSIRYISELLYNNAFFILCPMLKLDDHSSQLSIAAHFQYTDCYSRYYKQNNFYENNNRGRRRSQREQPLRHNARIEPLVMTLQSNILTITSVPGRVIHTHKANWWNKLFL